MPLNSSELESAFSFLNINFLILNDLNKVITYSKTNVSDVFATVHISVQTDVFSHVAPTNMTNASKLIYYPVSTSDRDPVPRSAYIQTLKANDMTIKELSYIEYSFMIDTQSQLNVLNKFEMKKN